MPHPLAGVAPLPHLGVIRAQGTMDEIRRGVSQGGEDDLEQIFLRLTGENAARELVEVLDA